MGLLDSLSDGLKNALGRLGLDEVRNLLPEALAKTDLGDLQGMVAKLQQAGLGAQVQSWRSNGPNLSVTPERNPGGAGKRSSQAARATLRHRPAARAQSAGSASSDDRGQFRPIAGRHNSKLEAGWNLALAAYAAHAFAAALP